MVRIIGGNPVEDGRLDILHSLAHDNPEVITYIFESILNSTVSQILNELALIKRKQILLEQILTNKNRLAILDLVVRYTHNISEISKKIKISYPNTLANIAKLKEAGLVKSTIRASPKGKSVILQPTFSTEECTPNWPKGEPDVTSYIEQLFDRSVQRYDLLIEKLLKEIDVSRVDI